MKRLIHLSALTAALALASATPAAADTTLGRSTPQAAPTSVAQCSSTTNIILQYADDPANPYFVPGPGKITSWSTYTGKDPGTLMGSTAGAAVTFVVLKPLSATSWSVVGTDAETLPTPLPGSNVATFTLPAPIAVSGGETLGIYGSMATDCYFFADSVPAASRLDVAASPEQPVAGQTVVENPIPGPSPGGFALNIAANFVPATAPAPVPVPTPVAKKKCKKKKKKKRAASAKKRCKKKHKKHKKNG